MINKMIYLDHAATTGMRHEAVAAMIPFFEENYGNAGSSHQLGVKSNKAYNQARRKIAEMIDGSADGIFFTSGASEANNWAIRGIAHANCEKGRHIITSKVEHPSVLRTCERLEREGYEISYLNVDETGRICVEELSRMIRSDTILVSVMYANNEVGTIQPIREIGALCREKKILFHVDAVQAFGKIPLSVKEDQIDLLTICGHKIYGPKGIGCLYIRDYIRVEPLIFGGGQQDGHRSGTLPIPEIVGFQTACEYAIQEQEQEKNRLEQLRAYMKERLLTTFDQVCIHENEQYHLPNILHISFLGSEAEKILIHLDREQIYASGGSACSSGDHKPSHTMLAMGKSEFEIKGSIRFSLGIDNEVADVDRLMEVLMQCSELHQK